MTERRAYLLLLAVILFWAGNYPLGKLALHQIGPLTLTGARTLIAGPLLLLVARVAAPLSRPLLRRDYAAFVVLGMTGLVLNTAVWYWGLAYTTALNAGILGAATPIFVAAIGARLLGDRLRRGNWAGIALSVAAVVATMSKGSLRVLLSLSVNRGDFIILASQAAWIAYTLYSRATRTSLHPLWIVAGANLVGAAVLVPLSLLVEGPWPWPAAAPVGWGVVLYAALLVTQGHLWYYAVVRRIGAGRAATFMNLMPFAVIALSWAIAGESVHVYHLVGAVLVIGGVLLASQ